MEVSPRRTKYGLTLTVDSGENPDSLRLFDACSSIYKASHLAYLIEPPCTLQVLLALKCCQNGGNEQDNRASGERNRHPDGYVLYGVYLV